MPPRWKEFSRNKVLLSVRSYKFPLFSKGVVCRISVGPPLSVAGGGEDNYLGELARELFAGGQGVAQMRGGLVDAAGGLG